MTETTVGEGAEGERPTIAIVDASNVANSAPAATPRLHYLIAVGRALEEAGLEAMFVADAGLARRIDDPDGFARLVERGVVREAPAGVEADEVILTLAREHGALVVSNDRFREWGDRFPEEVKRRVGFRVKDGAAVLRGLPTR